MFKEERNLAVEDSVGRGTWEKNHLIAHYNYVSPSQIVVPLTSDQYSEH